VTDPGYVPFIAIGVDGIITDVPDQLRTIMAAHGFELPKAYRLPRGGGHH